MAVLVSSLRRGRELYHERDSIRQPCQIEAIDSRSERAVLGLDFRVGPPGSIEGSAGPTGGPTGRHRRRNYPYQTVTDHLEAGS